MTQKQKDEMNKMLGELRILQYQKYCDDWRTGVAYKRLERFIREQCGDKAGAEWA